VSVRRSFAALILAALAWLPFESLFEAQAALAPAAPSLPKTHAGTAEDPIPIRFGDRLAGEITTTSPYLAAFGGNSWIEYITAPYPFPGAVVFALELDRDGPVAIEARSMDFHTGLRLSKIMLDGDVIPIAFVPGRGPFDDSEARPLLNAGVSYRVEVFPWARIGFAPQSGSFEVMVRDASPDL
jgi:hypothetical protein